MNDPDDIPRTRAEAAILALIAEDGGPPVTLNRIAQAAGGDPRQAAAWNKALTASRQALLKLEGEGLVVARRKGQIVKIRQAKGLLRYTAPPRPAPPAGDDSQSEG